MLFRSEDAILSHSLSFSLPLSISISLSLSLFLSVLLILLSIILSLSLCLSISQSLPPNLSILLLLLSSYLCLSISVRLHFFLPLYLFRVSISLPHAQPHFYNSFFIRALNGLKILSFGHVNPRSGAPGAGGKGPLFAVILIIYNIIYSYCGHDYLYYLCDYFHGYGLIWKNPLSTNSNLMILLLLVTHQVYFEYLTLGPAVMRGPIATRVITQLVTATEWGNLDYLLVDMPPGTYVLSIP